MTTEKLKETMKLADELETIETFQKAFHEPYVKGIYAYKAGTKEPVEINLEIDSELFRLIDDYLGRKLTEMKKKFEEM